MGFRDISQNCCQFGVLVKGQLQSAGLGFTGLVGFPTEASPHVLSSLGMSDAALTLPISLPVASPAPAAFNPGAGIDFRLFLDCVHCGLCTASCPTYLETGDENDSPRGRIYLMRAVTEGRMELSPAVERHLDLCLDCRGCETACPSGVKYGRLIEPFRAAIHAHNHEHTNTKQPAAPAKAGWFSKYVLGGLFPSPQRLAVALTPARWAQNWGVERLLRRSGLINLLPGPLSRMARLLPPLSVSRPLPDFFPALGQRRARVALFTGCVADAVFRHVHWSTARVLQHCGCEVVVPKNQACCGAIHYHNGSAGPAMECGSTNRRAFLPANTTSPSSAGPPFDAVIVNVAGCGSMLKDYGHIAGETPGVSPADVAEMSQLASLVKDACEFIAQLDCPPPKSPLTGAALAAVLPDAPEWREWKQRIVNASSIRAVYHDACHLAHAQKIREQPRQLLSKIPGLELLPLAESDLCCGAAGSYNLTEPDMADRLAQRKVQNVLAAKPDIVISANAGCTLQIQAALRDAGHPTPVLHPMELLDLAYRGA